MRCEQAGRKTILEHACATLRRRQSGHRFQSQQRLDDETVLAAADLVRGHRRNDPVHQRMPLQVIHHALHGGDEIVRIGVGRLEHRHDHLIVRKPLAQLLLELYRRRSGRK